MNFQEQTIRIFEMVYERLKPFHSIIQNRTAVLAYSGGKDSTVLSYFYLYLFSNSKCPEPILFHLNHSIRNNDLQEKEIELEMEKFFKKVYSKKKTFQKSPSV